MQPIIVSKAMVDRCIDAVPVKMDKTRCGVDMYINVGVSRWNLPSRGTSHCAANDGIVLTTIRPFEESSVTALVATLMISKVSLRLGPQKSSPHRFSSSVVAERSRYDRVCWMVFLEPNCGDAAYKIVRREREPCRASGLGICP